MQRKFANFCLSPSWCLMPKRSAETFNHLFLRCLAASKLWYKLCKEDNFLKVIPGSWDSLSYGVFLCFW